MTGEVGGMGAEGEEDDTDWGGMWGGEIGWCSSGGTMGG